MTREVETVARALCRFVFEQDGYEGSELEKLVSKHWRDWIPEAMATLRALDAQSPPREDREWVMVPREPTREMSYAAHYAVFKSLDDVTDEEACHFAELRAADPLQRRRDAIAYKAGIAAAPTPPEERVSDKVSESEVTEQARSFLQHEGRENAYMAPHNILKLLVKFKMMPLAESEVIPMPTPLSIEALEEDRRYLAEIDLQIAATLEKYPKEKKKVAESEPVKATVDAEPYGYLQSHMVYGSRWSEDVGRELHQEETDNGWVEYPVYTGPQVQVMLKAERAKVWEEAAAIMDTLTIKYRLSFASGDTTNEEDFIVAFEHAADSLRRRAKENQ